MARYGGAIGLETGSIEIFDHDLGSFHASVCQLDESWSPASSNFDTTTGLPMDGTIAADGTSNPCSIAATSSLLYLLDPQTCRVLAIDPATTSIFATFGGRRGIGAGKIEPDGSLRSIVAAGNGKVFLTDNSGGFVVQYSAFGVFQAEYSIATWASDLALAFDQVTGIAYDTARSLYWILAQSSTAAYLFAVNSAGAVTGLVIDLTARLTTTLGIIVPGHSNSPAERVRTRGLYYNNGAVLLYSEGNLVKVDLTNTDGDQLLVAAGNDLSPGNWTSDGAEITYVLRDQPNNTAVVYVVDTDGNAIRSYGQSFSPPDGIDGHIATPWDCAVVPTVEDPSTRTARSLSLRARITAVAQQTMSMRASIVAAVARTMQMRARVLNLGPFGSQQQMTMRAAIEEPSTLPDGVAVSWRLQDSLGTYSRGLVIEARGRAGFQVGDTLTLYAGYGVRRVRIFHGEIDDIQDTSTPDQEAWTFSLRDVGAFTIDRRRFSKTFSVQFPINSQDIPSVSASTILRISSETSGVSLAGMGFPDYPLYANFVANNETLVQVAQRLLEPWNQFASRQCYPQVRNGLFRMVPITWADPPENGYVVTRGWIKEFGRKQTRYLGSPDLTGFDILIVSGATHTFSFLDEIGPETRVEYFSSTARDDTTNADSPTNFGPDYVLTETTNVEEIWGDKVLSRVSETVQTRGGTRLIAREEETTLYFEPVGDPGLSSIIIASAGPSALALPYQTNNITSGIDPSDNVFKPLNRVQTNYYYDHRNQLAAETTSTDVYDISLGRWVLDGIQHRVHSETTGGSTRVRRFSFDGDGNYDSSEGQQVGGGRPDPSAISANASVVTLQAIAPETPFSDGVPVDPGNERTVWNYSNSFLGQNECEAVLALAQSEKSLQVTHKEDEVSINGPLDVNLLSGMGVSVEIAPGVFEDYWVENVTHTFDDKQALTSFTAKRLTTEGF